MSASGRRHGGTTPLRAALYIHLTFKTDDSAPYLDQLRHAAKARGWQVVGEFIDRGPRWRQERRSAWKRLVKEAEAGGLDVVVVPGFARAFCSAKHLIRALCQLDDLGVALHSLWEEFDSATPSGRAQVTLAMQIIRFERDLFHERVLHWLRAKPGPERGSRARRRGRLRAVK